MQQGPFGVDAGQTIQEAVVGLGVPTDQLFVALINGQASGLSRRFAPDDTLKLIAEIGGGGG